MLGMIRGVCAGCAVVIPAPGIINFTYRVGSRMRLDSERAGRRDASLEAEGFADGASLVERLSDEQAVDPQAAAEELERVLIVRDAVNRAWTVLDPRERSIVRQRWLSADSDVTLVELGRKFGACLSG